MLGVLILTWCVAACGDGHRSDAPAIGDCLGAVQNACDQDVLCVSVMAMNVCEAQDCDEDYVGCLPIDADCSDRDEALCKVEQACLSIYTIESEYVGCEPQLCDIDEDCAIEHGYACFEGFVDGQNRCRQGPIPCDTDADCPATQRCELLGEDNRVCI